jgi:pimeloyl-ACP methyl ester carboxylesterase
LLSKVIRKQKIPFRYDWEKVVTPVIDFVADKYEGQCDMKRLALMGISMGGYLAARAAAFEHRISACILDDGVYDIYENYMEKLGTLGDAISQRNATVVNTAIQTSMYFDTTIRWAISHGIWVFDAKDPLDFIQKNKDYTLKDVAGNIRCPTLVLEAEMDEDFLEDQRKYTMLLNAQRNMYYLLQKKELKIIVKLLPFRYQIKEYLIGLMMSYIRNPIDEKQNYTEYKLTTI